MVGDDHAKTPSWEGWADASVGLEMQAPFAGYILDGTKKIETRAYPLPPSLLSTPDNEVKIDILESQKGQDGVSSIPNSVSLRTSNNNNDTGPLLRRKGWCTFKQSIQYTSCEQFEADVDKHLVDSSSGYGWSDNRPMYGWVVGSYGLYSQDDVSNDKYITAERRMRSLFELNKTFDGTTILITGASGMLGRALHRLLLRTTSSSQSIKVIGTGHTRLQVNHYPEYYSSISNISAPQSKMVQLHHLDLLDFDKTTKFMQKHKPDIVVHCAAERYPDAFESKLEESIKLNVESTKHLANECLRLGKERKNNDKTGPHLIYISTSYVFDGGAASEDFPPYKPQSKANPLNNYGKSKWEGECVVRDILKENAVVVRVPLLYGEDSCDLSESPALEMMKSFLPTTESNKRKKIDHWALRFPTSVEDVARVLKLMIDGILDNKFPVTDSSIVGNTYHVASPHGTTKYELMQLQTKLLNVPTSLVEERTEGNSSGPPANSAPRPQCTQLDCSETWKALNSADDQFQFVSLEDGFKRALNGFPDRFIKP